MRELVGYFKKAYTWYCFWEQMLKDLEDTKSDEAMREVSRSYFDEFKDKISRNRMYEHMVDVCHKNMCFQFGLIEAYHKVLIENGWDPSDGNVRILKSDREFINDVLQNIRHDKFQ